jgi:hypothetical protein
MQIEQKCIICILYSKLSPNLNLVKWVLFDNLAIMILRLIISDLLAQILQLSALTFL